MLGCLPASVRAQDWNTPTVSALIQRAIARRTAVQADSGLRSYHAIAHGFVLFLGQLGREPADPPRLIKADQLALEVYWRAPGLSKQWIVGRRDRRDLPTDIEYHRDHLGIVQNNFGPNIRLGEGDEVRDVPHPIGPSGLVLYDFALIDSVTIELPPPQRAVRVYRVLSRPKDPGAARAVGTLFIDITSAELVRFRFQFTGASYIDRTVEDITVVLENGLWEGRYWLPRRQEIEIRRRTQWLDLPARGIIRGRWEIGDYQLNEAVPDRLFTGPEIVLAPQAVRDTFHWREPLARAIDRVAGPQLELEPAAVRAEIDRLVGRAMVNALPAIQPGFGSLSQLIHVNRVEGVTPGLGWVFRPSNRRAEIRAWLSYGFSDERVKARLSVGSEHGGTGYGLDLGHEIVDLSDEPVISPLLNSFLSQERGADFGDYLLLTRASARVRRRLAGAGGSGSWLVASAGVEHAKSVSNTASPWAGQYPSQPAAGKRHLGSCAAGTRSP